MNLPKEHCTKLADKSRRLLLVGYENNSTNYRFFDPATKKVHISRHVTFNERERFKEDSSPESINDSSSWWNIIEGSIAENDDLLNEQDDASIQPVEDETASTVSDHHEVHHHGNPDDAAEPRIGTRLRDRSKLKAPARYVVNVAIFKPPVSFEEALNGPDAENWRKAIDYELKQRKKNKTWELVPRCRGMRTIDSKWVFKINPGPKDQEINYKARLCARGFMQKERLDFNDTFAPVVRYDLLRTLLAYIAQENMETTTFDVKSAFLYGDLEEEIFMEVPKGLRVNNNGDTIVPPGNVVCKLQKSLYGLKQAPRCWNANK